MKSYLIEAVNQFKKGKLDPQAFICVGGLNQLLKRFEGISESIHLVMFESNEGPSRILDFVMRQYGQSPPIDKNTHESKLLIINGEKDTRKIPKEFFKAFKTSKNDEIIFLVVPKLNSFVSSFEDLFYILGKVAKDSKSKKIRILFLFHFDEHPNLNLVDKDFAGLPLLEFETKAESQISSLKTQSIRSKTPGSSDIGTSISTKDVSKRITPAKADSSDTRIFAKTIFQEKPVRSGSKENIADLDHKLAYFQSILVQLHEQHHSGLSPDVFLLADLEKLFKTIIFAQGSLLKPLIEPTESLCELYIKADYSTNSASIARMVYSMLYILKNKLKR
ncbi:MAG: hypothetical protein ACXAC7_20215, partial [Candidatus Hodarchaeales archaeon]